MNGWFPALALSAAIGTGADDSGASDVLSTTTDRAADNSALIATLTSSLEQAQTDLIQASSQIALLQSSDAFTLTMNDKRLLRNDYAILRHANDDHVEVMSGYGAQVSPLTHAGYVNRPTGLKKVGDDLLVMNYYHKPVLIQADSKTITRQIPVTYQNPSTANEGMAYSYGGAVDVANNRVAVASWARHIVRVYALDTGDYQYTVGVPSGAGHMSYGKLYYASQCMFHPVSGNLIIISYYGYGDDGEDGDCSNHGHISEFDPVTGEFIATRQGFKGGGTPAVGYIYRPIDGFIQNDGMMWVSVYGRNMLAKLDTNSLTAEGYWPVVDYIAAPPGESITSPWGICECSDGDVALVCVGPKALIKINPQTKTVTAKVSLVELGLAGDPRRVAELEPGVFAITDWASNQMYVVPVSGKVTAQYETSLLPEGWEYDSLDEDFNPETGIMTKTWVNTGSPFPAVVAQCMRKVSV